ncbi:MAG: HU family DNA-binding protein [Pseudomonadales bacterium]
MAARKVARKTSKAKAKKAAPKKKAAAKRKVAKKAAPKKAARSAVRERYTKTQIVSEIAESTQLSRGQVNSVLDELSDIIEGHIKKRAVGEFTLPGLLKIKTVKKPARKARKNVPNPFRPGETMDVAAKPASTTVKVLALKKLKEMAQ